MVYTHVNSTAPKDSTSHNILIITTIINNLKVNQEFLEIKTIWLLETKPNKAKAKYVRRTNSTTYNDFLGILCCQEWNNLPSTCFTVVSSRVYVGMAQLGELVFILTASVQQLKQTNLGRADLRSETLIQRAKKIIKKQQTGEKN